MDLTLLPSSIIQKYLDANYTYQEISTFKCSVRTSEKGEVFFVTSPKGKVAWIYSTVQHAWVRRGAS